MPRSIREILDEAKRRLRAADFEAPPREAHLLLGHVLGRSEVELRAHDEAPVEADAQAAFEGLLNRRLRGEPIAYLVGRREFYGRFFQVDDRVLIPRPETEHLIAAVLELDLPPRPRILDLGTGSGCIAVTLALELPGARVLAADRSLGALAVAAVNNRALTGESLRGVCDDWLGAVDPATLDLVVTNPPYIAREAAGELSPEIRHFEPDLALFGADDGLGHYRALYEALDGLRSGVPVVSEIGLGQADEVVALAAARGFAHLRTVDDYAGIARIVVVNRA